MRRISLVHALLAAGVLIATPLINGSEVTSASEPKSGESALCFSSTRANNSIAALMSFAGYRRVALGLPWEEISTLSVRNRNSVAVPMIFGLPMASGPRAAAAPLAQTIDVQISNNYFTPATVRISVGDTVRWTWQGFPHSVTSGLCLSDQYEDCTVDNKFCSPTNTNCAVGTPSGLGFVYSFQFNVAGTYPYFCNQHFGLMNGTVIVETSTSPTIQFSAGTFSIGEGGGAANITVSRSGSATSAASVDYATSDTAGLNNCSTVNNVASSRCDYPTSVGTVRFAAGETSKSISIPVVDDSYAEGGENFTITLSNANGGALGSPTAATVTINDNEASNGANPVDGTPFFVRQQYIDFLNREPDPGGNAAWQSVINNCPPNNTTCDRIHVSSSFFLSPEFQGRGYFVYRFYPVSFGRKPDFAEFVPDIAKVSGFLSDAELEAAKVAFIAEFMSRPAFVTKFNGLTDTQYVDTLLSTAQVTSQHRDFWIAALGNGTRTRATVLRDISESLEVYNKYFNQAFVVMQYFGYLRRDPDAFYIDWIAVLDSSGDHRGMVNGFMNSLEYRFRFGP
jgi:plastocyanin